MLMLLGILISITIAIILAQLFQLLHLDPDLSRKLGLCLGIIITYELIDRIK